MDIDAFEILQLNCHGCFAVMCELGQTIRALGADFALVQEPYSSGGRLRGLPGGMRTFSDVGRNAAVIVRDRQVDCTVVKRTEFGICVSAEGSFGRVFLCSVYCRFGADLGPYLAFMESLLPLAGSIPLILGLDANAVSPLWYSKTNRRVDQYRERSLRGTMLSEWIITKGVHVINEPSDFFTFDGPNGKKSDGK